MPLLRPRRLFGTNGFAVKLTWRAVAGSDGDLDVVAHSKLLRRTYENKQAHNQIQTVSLIVKSRKQPSKLGESARSLSYTSPIKIKTSLKNTIRLSRGMRAEQAKDQTGRSARKRTERGGHGFQFKKPTSETRQIFQIKKKKIAE
jgi:hypothetical protein